MEFTSKNMLAISAASSVLGLILIYLSALGIESTKMEISEITFDHVGMSVRISGKVAYANQHPAGHVFLTVTDGNSVIQVPLFSAVANEIKNSELQTMPEKGSLITVTGTVGEYKGSLQIIPRKSSDLEVDGY